MKTIFRLLITLLITLGLVLQLFSSSVSAGANHMIKKNTSKANEYISQLQAGADPDTITRPFLRRHHFTKVKRNRREINRILDRAEALSRAGRRDLIQQINLSSKVQPKPRSSR